ASGALRAICRPGGHTTRSGEAAQVPRVRRVRRARRPSDPGRMAEARQAAVSRTKGAPRRTRATCWPVERPARWVPIGTRKTRKTAASTRFTTRGTHACGSGSLSVVPPVPSQVLDDVVDAAGQSLHVGRVDRGEHRDPQLVA